MTPPPPHSSANRLLKGTEQLPQLLAMITSVTFPHTVVDSQLFINMCLCLTLNINFRLKIRLNPGKKKKKSVYI